MSLFEKVKGATGDLVHATKEKVGEVAHLDPDKVLEAAEKFVDAGKSVSEGVKTIKEGPGKEGSEKSGTED